MPGWADRMLTSEDIRDRISVPKRWLASEQSSCLETEAEDCLDRIPRLVRAVISCDGCLISLAGDRRRFVNSATALADPLHGEHYAPPAESFCKQVVAAGVPIAVIDARKDHGAPGNQARDGDGIAYLGVPIHGPDGIVLGALCVVKCQAHEWTGAELAALEDFTHLVEHTLKARSLAADAMQAATDNALLAREYHHRVKNSIAVSASLVRIVGRTAQSVAELVRDCDDRFASLGRAQDLVIVEQGAIALGSVVDAVLSPFSDGDGWRSEGPSVMLGAIQVTPVALILHELATNSAKYGALKRDAKIGISWSIQLGDVTLIWEEATTVSDRLGVGFGSQLLDVAARQLKGRLSRSQSDSILRLVVSFPVDFTLDDDRAEG